MSVTTFAPPPLETIEVVDRDLVGDVLGALHTAVAALGTELASVEAAIAETVRSADRGPDDLSHDRPTELVRQLTEGMLHAHRAEIRRVVEDGERAAADRLVAARDEAARLVHAARTDVTAALLGRSAPRDDVPHPVVASSSWVSRLPAAGGGAGGAIAAVVVGGAVPAAEADDAGPAAVADPADVSGIWSDADGAAPEVPEGMDPAAYEAFWCERHDAVAIRGALPAWLEVVLPVIAVLASFVFVLLFLV